jgi:hypothetical protein
VSPSPVCVSLVVARLPTFFDCSGHPIVCRPFCGAVYIYDARLLFIGPHDEPYVVETSDFNYLVQVPTASIIGVAVSAT